MSVYLIADIKVTDGKWIPAYAASVHDLVHKHGGKYLARSGNVKTLEGKPLDTTLIALLEFPSEEAVKPSPPIPIAVLETLPKGFDYLFSTSSISYPSPARCMI